MRQLPVRVQMLQELEITYWRKVMIAAKAVNKVVENLHQLLHLKVSLY